MSRVLTRIATTLLALSWMVATPISAAAQAKAPCKEMRKVKLGVSVSPPNVVHTPVYVARTLGIFAQHCIEAEIVEFEGGSSAANLAAVTQGQALASINATAISHGLKAKQIWGMAPRLPRASAHFPLITSNISTTQASPPWRKQTSSRCCCPPSSATWI